MVPIPIKSLTSGKSPMTETDMNEATNYCSEPGARLLAEQIRHYWSRRGKMLPQITIETVRGPKNSDGNAVYCVRSNMIGGWPQ